MARKRRALNAKKHPWRCVAALCAATTHDVRRAILVELSTAPLDERALAEALRIRLPALKRHMKRLAEVDLVTFKNSIRRRTYSLGPRTRVRSEKGRLQLDVSATDGSRLTMTIAAPARQR
ncbi:MAG: winged helix-turn-helix domain-containing protein [Phycisphaerales bacterium]|nr:winged helix-turn-helix domain-containing protein [Phycisphaerales bacterium]